MLDLPLATVARMKPILLEAKGTQFVLQLQHSDSKLDVDPLKGILDLRPF